MFPVKLDPTRTGAATQRPLSGHVPLPFILNAMKLIGSLTSPYVRKVRVVMVEKKLEYEHVLDDVWAPEPVITRYNPLGKVPCLVLDEQSALFDSRVIVEYLDTLSPVGRLLPPGGRERADVKCWEALGDGVLDAALAVVIETLRRTDAPQSPQWLARQRGKIHATLDFMEKNLGQNPYCMGVNFSLADVSVGCALGYLDFRFPELDWRAQHPNLQRLHEKLLERPAFQQTMPQA